MASKGRATRGSDYRIATLTLPAVAAVPSASDGTFSTKSLSRIISEMHPLTLAGLFSLGLYLVTGLGSGLHALLTKADPRSALSWMAVCLLVPYGGALLYWLFGINRVRRRQPLAPPHPSALATARPTLVGSLAPQVRIGDALTRRSLEPGNAIEPLYNGELAFPSMLTAISEARESVWLSSYIFQTDAVGGQFIAALAAAVRRGVSTRVLVDGVGEWYDWPHVVPQLRRAGVPSARFLPPRLLPPNLSLNCRNHRKILVVDGRTAFIGGMNLGGREIGGGTGRRMTDIHFRLRGPVVAQLAEAFAEDWEFAATEPLTLPAVSSAHGPSVCRVITGGPDQDVDKLLLILLSALASAERHVQIMTPYFIPPLELVAALEATALRGVTVSIVLPRRSNLRYIDWATLHWIPALVARGVDVHLQPPPFSHAKLLVIDGRYAHIGSVNVDTRSLRLNFEIAVEVYDEQFCGALSAFIAERERAVPPLSARDAQSVAPLARVRNALCWLVSPYL
ncbi:MAG TPA: phospholipase D-like domain-containing protein [Burkholderiales bacterium]|nr:phospholipase D-like domain-containing protein [Burkholderiales bacterium]